MLVMVVFFIAFRWIHLFFFFQAEDGIRDYKVTGVQTCALPIYPAKTREAIDERGWATYGDLGHVDEEGYLFLSDRRAGLILSGGGNLYPQGIENALAPHPAAQGGAGGGVAPPDLRGQPPALGRLR